MATRLSSRAGLVSMVATLALLAACHDQGEACEGESWSSWPGAFVPAGLVAALSGDVVRVAAYKRTCHRSDCWYGPAPVASDPVLTLREESSGAPVPGVSV